MVTLYDLPSLKVYRLDLNEHKAELIGELKQKDVEQLFEDGSRSGRSQETSLGISCTVLRSVFQEGERTVANGSSCRANGYGFVIHERAIIPVSGKQTTWEADLVSFEHFKEPEPSLMRVPAEYRVFAASPTPER